MTESIVSTQESVLQPIKAVVAYLPVRKGAAMDCYEMPDGEKRVGYAGASTALNHEKDWVGRLPVKGKKLLKALEGEGWSGSAVSVKVEVRGTSTIAKTISVRDFTKLIGQDAIINRNPAAIALLVAFAEIGLEKAIADVFSGRNMDYLLQKIEHYSQWTYEELEEVLAYNRDEAKALYR